MPMLYLLLPSYASCPCSAVIDSKVRSELSDSTSAGMCAYSAKALCRAGEEVPTCSHDPHCSLSLLCADSISMCCRARAQEGSKVVVSPITGELIPVDQMAEHMRISLIDPKFQEQRQAMMSKIRETTKASDDEIGRNLMGLARKRPDVFGQSQCLLAQRVHVCLHAEADTSLAKLAGRVGQI